MPSRHTHLASLAVTFAVMLALSACSTGRPDGPGGRGGPRGGGPGGESGFDRASALLDAGEADAAHAGFLCIAGQGPGYEIAMHFAGMASLSAADAASPDISAGLEERGFLELIAAAEAGWPASQAELAERFSARGDDAGRARAAYWLAVLDDNARDRSLGLQRISPARRAAIEGDLGAALMAEGEIEAEGFTVTPLPRQDASARCTPWLVQAGMPRAGGTDRQERGGRGGQGRRGGGRRPGG